MTLRKPEACVGRWSGRTVVPNIEGVWWKWAGKQVCGGWSLVDEEHNIKNKVLNKKKQHVPAVLSAAWKVYNMSMY